MTMSHADLLTALRGLRKYAEHLSSCPLATTFHDAKAYHDEYHEGPMGEPHPDCNDANCLAWAQWVEHGRPTCSCGLDTLLAQIEGPGETKATIFHSTYVLDDAPGSNREEMHIGIGFEFDPEHGGITWVTREAARQLFMELAKSFPFGESGTEQCAEVTIAPAEATGETKEPQ